MNERGVKEMESRYETIRLEFDNTNDNGRAGTRRRRRVLHLKMLQNFSVSTVQQKSCCYFFVNEGGEGSGGWNLECESHQVRILKTLMIMEEQAHDVAAVLYI